jgi:hypothetical protein
MKKLLKILLSISIVLAPTPLCAWSEGGHHIITLLAFDLLEPVEKSQLLSILDKHPRFVEDFAPPPNLPNENEVTRWRVGRIGYWPDVATAHVIHTDGTTSPSCEFAVCDLDLRLPSGSVTLDKEWSLDFRSENMDIIAIHLWNTDDGYGRHSIFLTPEQRATGACTIPAGLVKKPGKLQVWLIGEHKLGRLKLRKDIPLLK